MKFQAYNEIMGGLLEAAARLPVRRRYSRAVMARLDRQIDPKKSLYKGHAHRLLLLNIVTRGNENANANLR